MRNRRKFTRKLRKLTRPARHAMLVRALRAAMWFCRWISHASALRLARILGWAAYHAARKERRLAVKNLESAYGDDLEPARRDAIVREVFQSTCMMAIEAMNSVGWSEKDYARIVEIQGLDHRNAALEPGRGAVFCTGHFGNWELMHDAIALQTGQSITVIMRKMGSPELTRIIQASRGSRGNTIRFSDESPLGLMRHLKRGHVISLLADQDTRRVRGMFIEFFGRPALTPIGLAFLARKTGAPLLPMFIHRRAGDPARHLMRIHAPIFPDPALDRDEDIRRMLQTFTDALESEIREHPGQWAWIHDRWRHRPKGE